MSWKEKEEGRNGDEKKYKEKNKLKKKKRGLLPAQQTQ